VASIQCHSPLENSSSRLSNSSCFSLRAIRTRQAGPEPLPQYITRVEAAPADAIVDRVLAAVADTGYRSKLVGTRFSLREKVCRCTVVFLGKKLLRYAVSVRFRHMIFPHDIPATAVGDSCTDAPDYLQAARTTSLTPDLT